MAKPVIVITGVRGMGLAIARRIGSGSTIVLADFSQHNLDAATTTLREEGQQIEPILTDVSNKESVLNLADQASKLGPIRTIAHTAGLSPVQAKSDPIYKVDLIGTVHVIDAFLPHASHGTSLVLISSVAGHWASKQLSLQFEKHLATAPVHDLLNHPEFQSADLKTSNDATGFKAYGISKRANQLRVQSSAAAWGSKGARINSISPGLIATPMGHAELAGPLSEHIQDKIPKNPVPRMGTASDVAGVVAFLCGSEAGYITGTDILLDGGWVAHARWQE